MGEFVADIVVESSVIVDLKSIKRTVTVEAQLVNYHVATGKPVGLLLDFGETKVQRQAKSSCLGYHISC